MAGPRRSHHHGRAARPLPARRPLVSGPLPQPIHMLSTRAASADHGASTACQSLCAWSCCGLGRCMPATPTVCGWILGVFIPPTTPCCLSPCWGPSVGGTSIKGFVGPIAGPHAFLNAQALLLYLPFGAQACVCRASNWAILGSPSLHSFPRIRAELPERSVECSRLRPTGGPLGRDCL